MSIQIVKGIPLPSPVRAGRPPKYKFDDMEVGDSFKVKAIYQTLYTAIQRYTKKDANKDKKFEIRKVGKEFIQVHRSA